MFRTTAYCPCRGCSGRWGGRTSTGAVATSGHTISVDPRVIPYGSRLMIGGVIYTAEDCGSGVRGNHIDIFFNTHGETRAYGTRSMEVFLVQ
jgi:3D (Asp-Asp-Asp) domain-containing protein